MINKNNHPYFILGTVYNLKYLNSLQSLKMFYYLKSCLSISDKSIVSVTIALWEITKLFGEIPDEVCDKIYSDLFYLIKILKCSDEDVINYAFFATSEKPDINIKIVEILFRVLEDQGFKFPLPVPYVEKGGKVNFNTLELYLDFSIKKVNKNEPFNRSKILFKFLEKSNESITKSIEKLERNISIRDEITQ